MPQYCPTFSSSRKCQALPEDAEWHLICTASEKPMSPSLLAKLGLRTMLEDVVTMPDEMRVHDAFHVRDLQRARHVRGDPGWCRIWSMMWTSTATVNECASVKLLGSGSCGTWSSSCLAAGCIPRRPPTSRNLSIHARGLSASFQDMQDTLATLGTFGKSCADTAHKTQFCGLLLFGPTVDRYVSVNSRARYA